MQRDKIKNDSEYGAGDAKTWADQIPWALRVGLPPQLAQSTGILLLPRIIRDPSDLDLSDK